MNDLKITVKAIDYHRNGICGQGFNTVLFDDAENGPMMAIVLDRGSYESLGLAPCFVLNTDMLAKGEIRFTYNSWRGDHYYDLLLDEIAKWDAESYETNKARLAAWVASQREDK